MYSGFWKRFAARIIDSIVLYVLFFLLIFIGMLFGLLLFKLGLNETTVGNILGFVGVPIYLTMDWIYYALFESSKMGATIGKIALGIKVVDRLGGRITFKRATVRFWCKIISALPLLIGFLIAGLTKNKQALHDVISATYVVNKKEYNQHFFRNDFKESANSI